jgi:hypothetical protein
VTTVGSVAAQPLIEGVSQFEVDFVIPRLGTDVPVGIDPFLLFKSHNPEFQTLHNQVLEVFRFGIDLIKNERHDEVRELFEFPEVSEIGLGYTREGKRGSGVGTFLSELIVDTLRDSPAMVERGVRHIEELQLISMGIGPDRVSDITASLIKAFLISYTQQQCALWNIQRKTGVPISHVFDLQNLSWTDGYFDLPISPLDNSPILFVPRRIVRALPWINYDDFVKLEFATYLRARAVKKQIRAGTARATLTSKEEVVRVTRREIDRVDRYVRLKEERAVEAQPSTGFVDETGFSAERDRLEETLKLTAVGRSHARKYQQTVLEILNFLFNPELIDGELEVRTVDGTERRDVIFTNDSDATFWDYIRSEHSALYLMFETKNTQTIEAPALNQTATYLGDRLGRLGFIATRFPPNEAAIRKAFSIFNDSNPRKVILFLCDEDFVQMLDMKVRGKNPMRHIQSLYRKFRTSVQ